MRDLHMALRLDNPGDDCADHQIDHQLQHEVDTSQDEDNVVDQLCPSSPAH